MKKNLLIIVTLFSVILLNSRCKDNSISNKEQVYEGFKNKGGYYEMDNGNTLTLKGIFRGVNIYVDDRGGDFHCVYEVKVNGCLSSNSIAESVFEIELDDYGVRVNDSLTIVIKHKEDCKPKVLNPECITGKYIKRSK